MVDINNLFKAFNEILKIRNDGNFEIKQLKNEENKYNNLHNDLSHKLELLELSQTEVTNIAYQMQYYKRERRVVKERLEELEDVQKYFDSFDKSVLNKMHHDIGVLNKRYKNKKPKIYAYRELEAGKVIHREYDQYELRELNDAISIPPKKVLKHRKPAKKRNRKSVRVY